MADEAAEIIQELQSDLDHPTWSALEKLKKLQKLKVLGRNFELAEPIFTKNGIETLAKVAFNDSDREISLEALRCLANALLLESETRQLFIDLGYAKDAALRLSNGSIDDEFLIGRILFLLTYDKSLNIKELNESHHLSGSIDKAIHRHLEVRIKANNVSIPTNPVEEMALCEMLKLVFNISKLYPDIAGSLTALVSPILQMIKLHKLPEKPLEQPINLLINALLNLDLGKSTEVKSFEKSSLPAEDQLHPVEKITIILDKALSAYTEEELDTAIGPIVSLIRKVYSIGSDDVRNYLRSELLPGEDERTKPLGKSDSLPSSLLNITTSALNPTLRELIPAVLFQMSESDPAKFIQNIGYGYASGFLMRNNISVPEEYLGKSERNSSNVQPGDTPVNPVTGQRLDAEPLDADPPMTEEEKMREAERLFVLIERLKKTGVMDIANPVEQAVQGGRFEELD